MTDTPHPPSLARPSDQGFDTWHPLPPAAGKVSAIVGALAGLPVAIATTVLASAFLPGGPGLKIAAGAILLLLCLGLGAVLGRARWRRTTWQLDHRGLHVRRGLVWRKDVLVPRSRVQHLDLERGPIERHFGLATLVAHTAGTRLSALRQSGFLDADAVTLRDALLPEPDTDDAL